MLSTIGFVMALTGCIGILYTGTKRKPHKQVKILMEAKINDDKKV